MKYKRTQKRSKQMWQRVEKFSIRKFSFGAASCLIGASLVGVAINPNIVDAALYYSRDTQDGNVTTLYTNVGDTPFEATGSGVHETVNVDKEIDINVDWSQYSKTNPYVTVTYKYNGGFEGVNNHDVHYGGGRPDFWFTTPIGLSEPVEIQLKTTSTNRVMTSWKQDSPWVSVSNKVASRYQNKQDAQGMGAGQTDKWERYNDVTGEEDSSGVIYRDTFDSMFEHRVGTPVEGTPTDQGIFDAFKRNTKSIYSDWERATNQFATMVVKYRVIDPTLKNDRYTLDFGAGVRIGHLGSERQRFKVLTVTVPVLYQDKELFEPKLPKRIGVENEKKLSDKEKAELKNKIWEANQDTKSEAIPENSHNKFIENVKKGEDANATADSSISISDDGTATITYLDGSKDVIPGTSLVYEKSDPNTTGVAGPEDYKYQYNPYEVDNYDSLTSEDIKNARKRFYDTNGMSHVEENGEWKITAVGEANTSQDFVGKNIQINQQDGKGYLYVDDFPNGGLVIPKNHLFKQKATKTFSADEAIKKGEKAIDNLTYLSEKEKEYFKNQLNGKTTQEAINSVVDTAIARNSKNESGLESKKREIKEKINGLKYLTETEKKAFRKQIDDQIIADPNDGDGTENKALDYTKGLLDKILTEAEKTNLTEAKTTASSQIENIKDSLKNPTADDYKKRIEDAKTITDIEKILEEAEKQKATNESQKAKDVADKLKDEYKKKIDQIPGLSDADREKYKIAIDSATSKGQLDNIIKDAESKATRDEAIKAINNLPHLNKAQKASLTELVTNARDKDEIEVIVTAAQGLDNRMDILQRLVKKATDEIAPGDAYKNAEQDKKIAFDKAKEKASKIADLNASEDEDAADTSQVAKMIDDLAKAIKDLTGQDAAIPVSKDDLKSEIDKSGMIKASPAYVKETDEAKKRAYDEALTKAQEVFGNKDATQKDVDDALARLQQARFALSGKAEDFTLAVKDGAAKISVVPKVGESLTEQADKDAVKAKVTANGNDLDDTYSVEYGAIAEKGDKKVVPVTVTHDGITRTVDVPVEGTDAAKSPLNDPEKVKVNNVANLSDDEKEAVKAAVKKANTNLTDDQISVDNTGKVTVTYSDKSQNELPASKTVEAKTEAEKALDKAKEQAKSDLTDAADKEKAEIEADKNLTEDQKKTEKDKVDKVKEEQEKNIDKATTPEDVTKATDEGKKAIDAVHKTELDKAKEQAKADLTEAANKEKAEIEADKNLTDQQKADKKAEVDKVKKAQEENIDKTGTTDEVAKATEDGKKAIDAVHKTELDKAKEKAKADLTEAANKEKAEIEADKGLTDQQKADKKAEVDKVKKAQEENIDKTGTTDEVAKATEDGKKAIDAVHQTDADKSTPTVTAGEVPVSVDPATDKKVAEADKKAITEAVVVPEGQPQPKDKQVKNDGEIVEGTGANTGKKVVVVEVTYPDGSKDEIEVPVRKATDQEKAKADLTKAADAEKAEIDEDNALSKKEKEALKKQVDELKAKHEENINNATSPEDIASATEKGRQEIAAVHTPQDITETAKRKLTPPKEKVKVTDINHLTDEEKESVKKAIVATNPQLEESEVYVSDKGDVASPKGYLEAEKVVVQALNKPATPVVVADPNHLTNDEKEKVKEAVANANPGLSKDDITVDDKGNVTTKNGDKLLAKDVVTPALKKPTTPVVVGNPNALTEKEKEDIKDAVAAANPGLNKGDVTVNPDGSVTTPKGNLPKEDVVTTVLNKPNKLVEVENPNSLTVKEKEAVKKAVVAANPGLTEDKVKVDDQGNVTTPQGNLPAKDVVTSTLKKPTNPVEVVNPSKLTEPEKSKIVEEIIKNNPDLADKKDKIKVDDQGNVETPKGNLPAEDVVTPALKKPTNLVPVKDVHNLTDAEKDAVKDAVVAANSGLNKDDVKVDGQGNVETPRGNLLAGEVVTPALKKPVTPVEVKDPKNLTEAEKDAVKDAVVAANPGLNKDDVKVDGQGNVETPQGNLPAKDIVTPALKKPVTPVGVKDSDNLTDKEKEDVKKAIVEANPGLNKDDVKVDDQGNVETPNGNLPKEDVVVQTAKGQSTSIFKPELDLQTALVSGKVTVEKGKDLTDEDILKQLALADGLTAKVISKPTTTETGTKEAEVEVTLANGTKVTVKVPVEVVDSLGTADKDNDLAKAKEDAKKQVEDAAKKKLDEIKKDTGLTEEQKQKAEEAINNAKEDANKAIDEASSAGTAKQIADQAKENIEKYDPKADTEVKKPDVTNLDEEKAKAKAEILEEAQKRIDEIKNNKDLSDEAKAKAIEEINKVKDKAIEDINKAQSKDEINAAKEAGIHKINEVQPEGSIASKFDPKVPENKVEVENPAKLSDEEREQVRQNIEGTNTFPDGTTVEVKSDGTALITYKDGSSDTISKDKLVAPANKETGTIASRTEPVIPGKTQVGNTTKLTPEEQAAVKKAVEEANNFPAGTTVEVRPDGTVVITYPDKSVDTIPGDKLVEKGSKQETPKVQTDAEKNPAQVPGNFVPVENTHNLTQTEQDTVAAKVKEANPAATDVKVSKDGTATLTYSDGSVNTIPGTSLVVAKDTDNEASTQAAQNPAVVPATTEVGNAHSLTPEEQAAVTAKVQAANPAATDVKVSKDGTATLTYSDGSVNTIPGTSLVVQKEEVPTQEQSTIAEKTKVIIPANPIKVAEATRLTDEEKEAVKKAVVDANGFGSDVKVEVAGDGTATIVFKDGSAITIPGNQLVAQDPKAQDSTKPTAEKSTVKAPAQRVDVKDITHLTDEEKEKVKVAILQANGSALDGATINVAGDGTATITFPDGSVVTILGKDTVQQSAKGESVTQEATPEYKPETTPGGDNGGNTGSSDANANAGGGSQAGGQAHTGSQTPAQSQASKQLANAKESAKNVIEKAAKDKQDEIKGSPLSDKEQAELLARVEAEKQAALKEIENAKTVEDVKEAETIGVQAIAMVTVPKRPVAPNAAPQATSAPQATAGTMQDVTYQSPAGKQLPNTGSASSAALASLGLVAATSGFALLGRKARRRK
ncbi:DUF1542 domain-containing protein [Streptococcus sp. 596553]|uniref:DUF1542 domain-containing protein n=1 Tax=Streptococcus sp. 596553 TaxID=2250596 RepID=UPI000DD9B532